MRNGYRYLRNCEHSLRMLLTNDLPLRQLNWMVHRIKPRSLVWFVANMTNHRWANLLRIRINGISNLQTVHRHCPSLIYLKLLTYSIRNEDVGEKNRTKEFISIIGNTLLYYVARKFVQIYLYFPPPIYFQNKKKTFVFHFVWYKFNVPLVCGPGIYIENDTLENASISSLKTIFDSNMPRIMNNN